MASINNKTAKTRRYRTTTDLVSVGRQKNKKFKKIKERRLTMVTKLGYPER